ncbi:porin [Burkholderia sp. Bp9143]|uniref:porin n=1 Tax=Burkholderia sp. Bp9143 TaxID=2184574 RepID=UPI000F5B8448|nr:porin [Burkholderia sp. Bp9143]RQR27738.1 porin [Burkholderia sp. Bp9143]
MKKPLMIASLLAIGATAHAQSSVTLYGRIDAGIEYMSGLVNANGGSTSRWRAESGDWGTSLWGMNGVEDLGGGNKAVFHLEGGLNTMNGTMTGGANQIFNRGATVGLANDRLGTLKLGQQLYITNTGIWDFDPFGYTSWSAASLLRGRNWPVTSNAISYQSPKFYGFDVYGQYSLSNGTHWNYNPAGQGRQAGLQITYTNQLFQARGIYDEIRDPANGRFDDAYNFSRDYFAGVNVFLGQFKVTAAYEAVHANGSPANGSPTTSAQQVWGGVTWQATPAAALTGAVYHVNASNGGGNATIYTVGGTYNLSKSTLLDFQVATVRNSKTANFGLEANAAGPGGPTNDNPLPGHSQSGVYVGIQHLF